MYMDYLVNEDSKKGNAVKGNADDLVQKLMENEKQKVRIFKQLEKQQESGPKKV